MPLMNRMLLQKNGRTFSVALPLNKRVLILFLMNQKPSRFSAWLLGGLYALAAAGCANEKEDALPDLVAVRYAQTQCADPWGYARNTPLLAGVAQAYLAQQGVTLHQPQASAKNTPSWCDACTCTTGVVLEGKVQPAEVAAVLALGFTKQ